ncbi:Hypothetical_protein [Hexamita inflata]|uniref:Hypothetical_protein n=1 Tax=Hexamita inflata TaxID=28002 RepID=A0AA86U5K8_9EUKA|nr:Hypothetical protein HINF_LOCUS26402 [Hexamita inflata]
MKNIQKPKFRPSVEPLKLQTVSANRFQQTMFIYYDLFNVTELHKIITFYESLKTQKEQFQKLQVVLINNQNEATSSEIAHEYFRNYPCYFDNGIFNIKFPYCYIFNNKEILLYEGYCLDKRIFNLVLE